MKHLQRFWSIFLLVIATFPFAAHSSLAAPTDSCLSSWSPVLPPSPASGMDTLYAVDAYSENDVWAVGTHEVGGGAPNQTLIQHWDGSQWTTVPSPNVPDSSNTLTGIDAFSPTDAWAVGLSSQNGVSKTLVQHWDGSTWTIVPSPNGADGSGELRSVAVETAGDVWASGVSDFKSMLLHWNGTVWQTAEEPTSVIVRVKSVLESHVWALGLKTVDTAPLLSWDGSVWTTETTLQLPNPSTWYHVEDFIVLAQDDIWLAGNFTMPRNGRRLLWHWDGKDWSEYFYFDEGVSRIAGVSDQNLWTIGPQGYTGDSNWGPIFSRWDGTDWSRFRMNYALPQWRPNAIDAVSADELWIVGPPIPTSSSPNAAGILHGQFTCTAPPTGATTPLAPINGAVVTEMYPTYDWQETPETGYYNLEIDTVPPGNPSVTERVIATEYQPTYPKLQNGTYTWRVQVCNYVGCGEWSEPAEFSMQVLPPADPPQLLAPDSGASLASHSVRARWSAGSTGSTYNLQLFQDSPDSQPISQLIGFNEAEFEIHDLYEGHFFWRVQTCNSGGCGPWAEPSEFTVYFPVPTRPVLLKPDPGIVYERRRPMFRWDGGEDGIYTLQLRYKSKKGLIVDMFPIGNSEFYRWETPLPDGQYYWRIKTCNVYRCSKWSKGRKFVIEK